MKRTVLLLLCVCILLLSSGCLRKDPDTDTQAPLGDPSEKEITPQEKIVGCLNENFNFTFYYKFTNLAYNGMEQHIEQTFAKDGSFSMISTWHQWHHPTDYEKKETGRFYYRYEGDQLVCYSQVDDAPPTRVELTYAQRLEMARSESATIGSAGIFPSYTKNFALTEEGNEGNTLTYTFELPVKDVLLDTDIMLYTYVSNAISLSRLEYTSPQDVDILCSIVVDKQTHRPITISYDFTELKPYVLPEDVLLLEESVEGGFLQMEFRLNYDLAETVPVPSDLLSNAL